ncbi:MAG: hypothetical protein QOD25_2197 [Alphaproteobacteria bacterium]|nr:hypothetical protein [Alphaproteobacteria bacterium]
MPLRGSGDVARHGTRYPHPHSRTSTNRPAIAAAAAMTGDTRSLVLSDMEPKHAVYFSGIVATGMLFEPFEHIAIYADHPP